MLDVRSRALANTYLDRSSAPEGVTPVPDPNYPLKTWFLPVGSPLIPAVDGSGNCLFNRFPSESEALANGGQLPTFLVQASKVSVLNLPGAAALPPYTPAPSGCSAVFPTGEVITIPAAWLSTIDDAEELAEELAEAHNSDTSLTAAGGVISFQVQEWKTLNDDTTNGAPFQYASTELRRVYMVVLNVPNGTPLYAGALIAAKNLAGVGHPGHWNMTNPSNPIWILDPISTTVARGPAVPMPVPALKPGETAVYLETVFGPVPAYDI
jgi:hypothetical protein